MKTIEPLNNRQARVLQCVADGCPDDVMNSSSHKRSAATCETTDSWKVSKPGGV
jgi:predicted nucleic acid-binding Zn ribbon protein